MANSAPSGPSDYNTKIIEEFRANGGHVGGPWAGITLILIHHVSASPREMMTPEQPVMRSASHLVLSARDDTERQG